MCQIWGRKAKAKAKQTSNFQGKKEKLNQEGLSPTTHCSVGERGSNVKHNWIRHIKQRCYNSTFYSHSLICIHVHTKLTFWMGVARLQMTETHWLATSRNRDLSEVSSTNGRVPPSITRAFGRSSPFPPSLLPTPLLGRPTFHRKASGLVDSLESWLLSVL